MSAMQYKTDFCQANKCTPQAFERAYVRFMEKHNRRPSAKAYRRFAKRWQITIHAGLGDSKAEAELSVNVAVIKVLASSNREADTLIREIVSALGDNK